VVETVELFARAKGEADFVKDCITLGILLNISGMVATPVPFAVSLSLFIAKMVFEILYLMVRFIYIVEG
jgi:hypothetical protein